MDLSSWCLAMALYSEARGEPRAGQEAVAHVIFNRSELRGKDLCGVIYEPKQFTDIEHLVVRDRATFSALHELAKSYIKNPPKIPNKLTHFHSTKIPLPKWAYNLQKVTVIGGHVFYEEKISARKHQSAPFAAVRKLPSAPLYFVHRPLLLAKETDAVYVY